MDDIKLPHFRPGLYRHKKGGLYQALGLAVEESTLKPVVIYVHVDGEDVSDTMWTRPLASWNEIVEWPDGSHKQRFIWANDGRDEDLS